MKNIMFVGLGLLILGMSACSTDPDSPPKFRVKNDRTANASLQVKTSGGNTININNVAPGSLSAYQEVAAGQVDVTLSLQDQQGSFAGSFYAQNNQTYTVVVANTTPPSVGIVIP